MDLYFSPLACSLATRIALYEAGAEANFLEVDPKTKIVQNECGVRKKCRVVWRRGVRIGVVF